MGSKPVADASVTEEEIIQMIRQGIQTGAFEASEEGLIENVFRLDDHRITEVMIPRKEVIWLDVNDPEAEWKQTVIEHGFSFYPVCNGSLDQVIGMVRAKDLLKRVAQGESFELISVMSQPLFIPESSRISHALELFKAAQTRAALVLDEHGGIEGMVTFRDILQEMVGDLEEGEPEATRREDGSWLLDGRMPLYKLFELFPDLELPPDEKGDYSTLAGFLLARFRHVPKAAEHLTYANLRFEIMDMDGVRIDKVLVTTAADESEQAGSG
jgi:putative hemolysin